MSTIKQRKEKDCLNCGHEVEDRFCSHCGQENLIVKENAWHMVTHAIADYFHFEHKFFATMRPLLLKPGQLTRQYVSGKRASFIHPIRLYIFISIVFFLVILSKAGSETTVNITTPKGLIEKAKNDSIAAVELRKELDSTGMSGTKRILLENALDQIDHSKKKDKQKKKKDTSKYSRSPSKAWVLESDTTYAAYLNRVKKLPKEDQPGLFRKYFAKNQIKFRGEDGRKKFKENLIHNIPKMMFILLPLFAAMLHLFYIRKKRYYYEDLIYSFHLHSCIFLSILAIKLVDWLVGFAYDMSTFTGFLLFIYITWYIYRSLRVFYNSSRWKTVLKIFFLLFGYMFLLTISFTLVAALTVMAQ